MTRPDAVPGWAKVVQRTSVIAFLCLPVGALGTRFGAWHYTIGLGIFGIGLVLVLLTGLVGLVGVLVLRRRGVDTGALQTAPFLAVLTGLALYPHIRAGLDAPAIHQVSTDLENPPAFDAILRVRDRDANPLRLTPEVIAAQREAYPWITTLVVRVPSDIAYEIALQVAEDMALEIISADDESLTIEATASTFWFGFKDDLVVRIDPRVTGTRVDVRSVSRVGEGDLGANADRIGEFFRRFENEISEGR